MQKLRGRIQVYEANPDKDPNELIPQATYRWDPEAKMTRLMRLKESAEDYRYFPEPDLPPIVLTQEYVDEIAKDMPELPFERKKRYVEELHLTREQADTLVNEKKLSDYFEESLESCKHPINLCNWIIVEFQGRFRDTGVSLPTSMITPDNVAKLVNFIEDKTITGKIAKKVADDMIRLEGRDCGKIIKANPDYQPVRDLLEIEKFVDQVLEENPKSVADYKSGKEKAFGFLVGQVMKLSRGKAAPSIVNEILKKKL